MLFNVEVRKLDKAVQLLDQVVSDLDGVKGLAELKNRVLKLANELENITKKLSKL